MTSSSEELIQQYEKQIQIAQLESNKRQLQITYAKQKIKEYQSKSPTSINNKTTTTTNKNKNNKNNDDDDESSSRTTDYYTQERKKLDLKYADHETVRSVLLHELGGDNYVPPAMSKADGGETSSSIASSTLTHKNDRVIIRTGDKVHPEISFHCTSNYRFSDLLGDACNFYGVPLDDFELVDSNGSKFAGHLTVKGEYALQLQNNIQPVLHLIFREQLDVGRIYNWRHPKPSYLTEADVALKGVQLQADIRKNGTAAATVPMRIQRVVRQMGVTLLIVVLMSIALVFRRNVQSMYFMTQSVRTRLVQQQFGLYMDKTFRDMNDIKDIYEWMEGPLIDSVAIDIDGDQQQIIERSFRQVGAMRLRQLRVKKGATCSLSTEFPQWEKSRSKNDADSPLVTFVEDCIGNYWEFEGYMNDVETAPYGPAKPGDTRGASVIDQEGFVYNSPTNISNIQYISTYRDSVPGSVELQSFWILGDFALYGPGGYIVEFAPGTAANVMRHRIHALKHGRWIDEQTRAIVVGINLYNGNYNYYIAAQLRIEIGTSGALKAKEKMLAFSIDVFDLQGSTSALAGEILLFVIAAFIFGVVTEHVMMAYNRGCIKHCADFYNALSFSAYGIYAISQFLRVGLFLDASRTKLTDGVQLKQPQYVELSKWGEIITFIDGLEAIALILMYGTLLQFYAIFPSPHTGK